MNNLQKTLCNTEYERSLLASIMDIDSRYHEVSEIICEADFYSEPNRIIFRAIKSLFEASEPVDVSIVHDRLERTKMLASAGGDKYLAEIFSSSLSTSFNLVYYAERVKSLSIQRQICTVLEDARLTINDDGNELDVKVNNAISDLLRISETDDKNTSQPQSISDLIEGFVQHQEDIIKGVKKKSQETGFFELDNKSPIQNGNLVVLAARPAMGKTTLALNILSSMVQQGRKLDENGAVISEKTGVIFSLEMSKDEMFQKFVSAQAGVDISNIKKGKMSEDDWASVMKVITEHKEGYPLFIDDRAGLTYQQIRTSLIKLKSQGADIGVVVIDYLQIMGGLDANNLTNSIGEITTNLKAIAKEFNSPVIALSQLNRSLESRPNKRPICSDLKSSGSIEQDADIIMFVYRDEAYNENSEHKGVAEIIIGKNRHGEIGTVRLGFEGSKSKFTNFKPTYDEVGEPYYN